MTGAVTDYQEAIAYLEAHIGLGMKPGLERITRLLEMMGNPQEGYPAIHITGSNGKTSTARILAPILAAHGLKVGTFTSPHLERWEERLGLTGSPTTPEDFARAVADVAPFVDLHEEETGDRATIFELLTAAAFGWFAERAVDVAVVEVGLGGRLDSTNVLQSRVAVVTGISLEHTAVLGDTLAEITAEKAAIWKPGGTLVTGPLPPEAREVIEGRAAQVGEPWRRYGEDFGLEEAAMAVGGWVCDVAGVYETYRELPVQLHGRHQLENLAVAVASAEELFGRPLSLEALREGVAAATSPGRLEVVNRHPTVLLDGAHNPAAFRALAAALEEEFPDFRWTLVLGVLGDKDLPRMLEALKGRVGEVFAAAARSERAVPAAEVARTAAEVLEVPVHEVETVPEATARALAAAGAKGAVLVCGSLYVVGEARPLFRERAGAVPPASSPN